MPSKWSREINEQKNSIFKKKFDMEVVGKPREERIVEAFQVMKSLRDDLKLPMTHPSVLELKKVLDEWITTGKSFEGTINFSEFGRMAEVKCPLRSDKALEVKLRVVRVGKKH
jgi:hypothetical protein